MFHHDAVAFVRSFCPHLSLASTVTCILGVCLLIFKSTCVGSFLFDVTHTHTHIHTRPFSLLFWLNGVSTVIVAVLLPPLQPLKPLFVSAVDVSTSNHYTFDSYVQGQNQAKSQLYSHVSLHMLIRKQTTTESKFIAFMCALLRQQKADKHNT